MKPAELFSDNCLGDDGFIGNVFTATVSTATFSPLTTVLQAAVTRGGRFYAGEDDT